MKNNESSPFNHIGIDPDRRLYLLGSLYGYQSLSYFTVVNEETSNTINDLKLNAVLVNIFTDENSCFHCVETHIYHEHNRCPSDICWSKINIYRDVIFFHLYFWFNLH